MLKFTMQLKVCIFLLLAPWAASGHHSRSAFFDQNTTVEVEGVITRVLWRHPHVRFWVQADESYGGALWELESTPPSILEREGISRELWAPGARVRVAGAPARRVDNAMEVSHVLLPDGTEVLLYGGLSPIWSDKVLARELLGFSEEAISAAQTSARGIFRVWSREGGIANRPRLYPESFPLTPAAQAAASAFVEEDHLFTGCVAKVMPGIMDNIWPFEFVDEGEQIRLKIEEFDQQRIIHMGQAPAPGAPDTMGYSTGRWEDNVLIVNTGNLIPGDFGAGGIMLSNQAELVERFILSDDETRLDYTLTVTDSLTFTSPLAMTSYWIWRPGEVLKPYDCIEVPESWTTEAGPN